MSCVQGQKNLNDVLSQHKEVVAKEGLGFDPSSSKKKNVLLKRAQLLSRLTFVREGHKEKGKGKVDGGCEWEGH